MSKINLLPSFSFLPQYSLALISVILSDDMLIDFFKEASEDWKKNRLEGLTNPQYNTLEYIIWNACDLLIRKELEDREQTKMTSPPLPQDKKRK